MLVRKKKEEKEKFKQRIDSTAVSNLNIKRKSRQKNVWNPFHRTKSSKTRPQQADLDRQPVPYGWPWKSVKNAWKKANSVFDFLSSDTAGSFISLLPGRL